jgi:SAM-dependent methyltransferase
MDLVRSLAIPVAKTVVPLPIRRWVNDELNVRRTTRDPGRILLVNEILPAFASFGGRILWVGCRRYTSEYGSLLSRHGGECWTVDIEIAHARWGEAGRHFTWDLTSIDQLIAYETFDSVLCNGVFGFGVDTRESQLAALMAMGRILKPAGRLLLGWNTDRVEDPLSLDLLQSVYVADDPLGKGARLAVPEAGYVYEFLRRNALPIPLPA